MTLEQAVSGIQKAKKATILGYPGYRGCCPAHEDANPSFCIWEGDDGWWHVKCPKCSEEEILRGMGLAQEDRRIDTEASAPVPETYYIYRDAQGQQLFRKRRFYKKQSDGSLKKSFAIERYESGKYVSGLDGLTHSQKDVLYNLPAVLRAVAAGETIYINEGEKACDRMARCGFVATCQPFGADKKANTKWKEPHTALLKGAAEVVVVADRDDTGDAYAAWIASQLKSVVGRVRVVRSRTTNEKDDAYDHFQAGYGVEEFSPASDLTPRRGLATRTMAPAFVPVEARFLVEPYLPEAKNVLLDADGGTGKTTMALAWAAFLSRGVHPLTFQPLPCGPITTLYLHKGEDSDEELETVYRANGGVPGRIHYAGHDLRFDRAGLDLVRETIEDVGARLVVTDALFYFLLGVVEDSGKALDVLKVMEILNEVAAATRATFLNIRHTTKGHVGKQASELGMGSVQFRNSHRGQLVARWHPSMKGVVVVTDEKGSLLVPRGDHFAYRRLDMEVHYVRNIANPFEGNVEPGQANKLTVAEQYLREALTDQYVAVQQVIQDGEALGISKRTIETARANLKVQAIKNGPSGNWLLHLPKPDPFAEDEYAA